MTIAGAEANVKVDYPTDALRQAQNKPHVSFSITRPSDIHLSV